MAKKPSKKNFRHKSFRRSYREDYVRELNVPGPGEHVFTSFKMIFKNWKLFLPLLVLSVVLSLVLIGVNREIEYSETTITFGALIFLMIFLITTFILRQLMAGHKIKFRDALYNSMTPLLSTLVVFLVVTIQCVPIFLLIIAYSAAVQTDFFSMPFYALLFFVFAGLMIVISGYLLSSSLIALVAVSAPGLYPMKALETASELMIGRRMKFILRLIVLIVVVFLAWVIVMGPIMLMNSSIAQFDWAKSLPLVSIFATIMTCFTEIYISTYFYLYYKWMLES